MIPFGHKHREAERKFAGADGFCFICDHLFAGDTHHEEEGYFDGGYDCACHEKWLCRLGEFWWNFLHESTWPQRAHCLWWRLRNVWRDLVWLVYWRWHE